MLHKVTAQERRALFMLSALIVLGTVGLWLLR